MRTLTKSGIKPVEYRLEGQDKIASSIAVFFMHTFQPYLTKISLDSINKPENVFQKNFVHLT
jgi:hypothetical protein